MIDPDATNDGEGRVDIVRGCPFCGSHNIVENVLIEALDNWEDGELIQNAFPEMSAENREIIMTGIGPCCW
jgi:hypothetical protein